MVRVQLGRRSLQIAVVDNQNELYRNAVELAQRIYHNAYAATIEPRPSRFVVCIDEGSGNMVACAGLTFAGSLKLFSEHYMNAPLEDVLKGVFGTEVPRARACEISSLATLERSVGAELVRIVPFLCWFMGQRALICTVTSKLKQLIEYQKWPFMAVAAADVSRVPKVEGIDWGTYYDTTPDTLVVKLDEIGHLFNAYCSRYSYSQQPLASLQTVAA